jgi:SAM-dependent methyltransferase
MFDRSAHLYDLFYEKGLGKDYAAGADDLVARLPGARTLLDVACGTGLHLGLLRDRFDSVAGIDLEPGMVEIARGRLPGVDIELADMVDFDLGRRFDAVICMFSSIGYVRTEERLRRAIAAMAAHLEPGGTLLIEPWLQREVIRPGWVTVTQAEDGGVTAVRMSHMVIDGDESVLSFDYLVGTPSGVEHLRETHVLGLFTWDQYRDAFERAGLATTVQTEGGPMGRGLLTGRS